MFGMMNKAQQDFVTGDDGWISDESSFYGDEQTKAEWEELVVDRSDIYLKIASALPANIAASNLHANPTVATGSAPELYWPMEDNMNARQSTESPEEFVKRLPPSSTMAKDHGEWLCVHNPRSPPLDKDVDMEAFTNDGNDLLEAYTNKQSSSKTKQKNVAGQREDLKGSLIELAKKHHYLSGKWMLFPPNDDNLDQIWQTVVKAVTNNYLGSDAKIATEAESGKARLICIYTKDFTDLKDVRRVLDSLVGLDLTSPNDKQGIWYKCNAYTSLGIEGKNAYGLRNSMYGSKELLGHNTRSNWNF